MYAPASNVARLALPFYTCPISAGFPSPAEDYLEANLDLNEHLVKHPAATFFLRVSGDSMVGCGIHSGDLLVVDRALAPTDGRVVIAVVNGEMLVKRLNVRGKCLSLIADNPHYPPLQITEAIEFQIWGVATSVIHSL